jgi:hypothetical protein
MKYRLTFFMILITFMHFGYGTNKIHFCIETWMWANNKRGLPVMDDASFMTDYDVVHGCTCQNNMCAQIGVAIRRRMLYDVNYCLTLNIEHLI